MLPVLLAAETRPSKGGRGWVGPMGGGSLECAPAAGPTMAMANGLRTHNLIYRKYIVRVVYTPMHMAHSAWHNGSSVVSW
jgi:hypothetical protein